MRGGFLPLRKGNAGAQAIVRSRIAVRLSGSPHSLRGSAAAEYGCLMTGQENERGAPLYFYERGERSMNYDPELAALLSQTWSNDACRGYVIAAMERCGFKPSDIEQVMVELYEVFDYTTLQEAEAYYERSPY